MAAKKHKLGTVLTGLFLNNIVAKLMALVMALALWFYAYNVSIARGWTRLVPVTIIAPAGWSVDDPGVPTVRVTMDFPQRFKSEIDLAELYIVCSADSDKDKEDDSQTVSITLELRRHLTALRSFGVRNVRFVPPAVAVEIVRNLTKELPVDLGYSEPPEGYELSKTEPPSFTPTTVSITGRKDVLSGLEKIETKRVDISKPLPGKSPGWRYTGDIAIVQSVKQGGKEFPITCVEKVNYVIMLERKSAKKEFEKVPILLTIPPDYQYDIELKGETTRTVIVEGPEGVVNDLKAENIQLSISPGAKEPNDLEYPFFIKVVFHDVPYESMLSVQLEPSATIDVLITKRSE